MRNQEESREREAKPLEAILDRYARDLALSPEHVADLFPGIFYDREEMDGKEFYFRMRKSVGTGLSGVFRAEIRFKRMDTPPVFITRQNSRIITPDDTYSINRQFYENQEFYQTEEFQQIYHFVADRLKAMTDEVFLWDLPIGEIGLNKKTQNRLRKAGVSTVEDISQMTANDLNKIYGIGRKHIYEIEETLDMNRVPHNVYFSG